MSGIASAVSGSPLTVRSGVDNSLTGIGADTADLIGEWRLPDGRSKHEKLNAWFNAAAFVQNAPGTFGNTGINFMRGPGSLNLDFAAQKQFRITEQRHLDFRGSFYNMINHANLGNPNATRSNATFGKINSASTPRVIELGLRFAF